MSTDPNPEFAPDKVQAGRRDWCQAYVHVWADLSRGDFDPQAVERAADEHWQRSPQSDPVETAVMDFLKAG
jgi:hypothetical protein